MTTVTIPITLTIDGVAVPSSMTLDPSLLPAGPKGATGLQGIPGPVGPMGPAGGTVSPPVVPPVTPPPTGTAKVVQFAAAGSPSSFLSAMAVGTTDVIELGPGAYPSWHLWFNIDRTARPLLVCPANPAISAARAAAWIAGPAAWKAWKATQPPYTKTAGAQIVFSGDESGDGFLYPGWNNAGLTAHITFDAVGGTITLTGFILSQTGLCSTAWVETFEASGFITHNITAPSTNGSTAWNTYASSDGIQAHNGKNVTFDDWEIHLEDDPLGKVNGHQVYHAVGYMVAGYTNQRTKITGNPAAKPQWGFVLEYDATGVLVSDGTITNCQLPFDSRGPAGVVKNMKAVGCGQPIIDAPMVDGGGSSWA
jgi:hypothetical protein